MKNNIEKFKQERLKEFKDKYESFELSEVVDKRSYDKHLNFLSETIDMLAEKMEEELEDKIARKVLKEMGVEFVDWDQDQSLKGEDTLAVNEKV